MELLLFVNVQINIMEVHVNIKTKIFVQIVHAWMELHAYLVVQLIFVAVQPVTLEQTVKFVKDIHFIITLF
jgi:hypothetical protein